MLHTRQRTACYVIFVCHSAEEPHHLLSLEKERTDKYLTSSFKFFEKDASDLI